MGNEIIFPGMDKAEQKAFQKRLSDIYSGDIQLDHNLPQPELAPEEVTSKSCVEIQESEYSGNNKISLLKIRSGSQDVLDLFVKKEKEQLELKWEGYFDFDTLENTVFKKIPDLLYHPKPSPDSSALKSCSNIVYRKVGETEEDEESLMLDRYPDKGIYEYIMQDTSQIGGIVFNVNPTELYELERYTFGAINQSRGLPMETKHKLRLIIPRSIGVTPALMSWIGDMLPENTLQSIDIEASSEAIRATTEKLFS